MSRSAPSSTTCNQRSGGDAIPQSGEDVRRQVASEVEIREAVAELRAALDERQFPRPNIWVFYSNKLQQLLTIYGDVPFIQAVLLEGDPTVASYNIQRNEEAVVVIQVVLHSGSARTYRCTRGAAKAGTREGKSGNPEEADPKCIDVTARSLANRMIEFANWLMLCGAMTRAKAFTTASEASTLLSGLRAGTITTIHDAITLPECDPALMLAAIAKGLASGVLWADLSSRLLDVRDPLMMATDRHDGSASSDPAVELVNVERASSSLLMPRNRRTTAHPELFAHPERWLETKGPELPVNEIDRRHQKAVQMYLLGCKYDEIYRETSVNSCWVRGLFLKTLVLGPDGIAVGVRGLHRYSRSQDKERYVRKAPLPSSGVKEGAHGGYAGAFWVTLKSYSTDLTKLIEDEVLAQRARLIGGSQLKTVPGQARVSWIDVHRQVLDFLQHKGVKPDQYPFNTRDQAYRSLVRLCNALLHLKPYRWLERRSGKEAERRGHLSGGYGALISPRWPYQILDLDFHREDCAATIEVETPKGGVLDVPVARWWCGGMVDEFSHAFVATSDSFQFQTTQDCVLELVDSAVLPPKPVQSLTRMANGKGGVWQPNQIIPELAWQAWDILKLDRAWAHSATDVITAVVATVGCAIGFSPPRHWWARKLMERGFGKMTQVGAQKMPSTFGTGPGDSVKTDPDAEAEKLHLRQSDVCDLIKITARWLNESSNEGVHWSSSLDILRRSVSHLGQPFFPRPYPRPRIDDRPTLWRTVECKIEGDLRRGIAPCVRVKRTRFYGKKLGGMWGRIGDKAYLQVQWRHFQLARLVSFSTGELLDTVVPEAKWRSEPLRWQDYCLIQDFGRMAKRHLRTKSPARDFLEAKGTAISQNIGRAGTGTQVKRDAAQYANVARSLANDDGKVKPPPESTATGSVHGTSLRDSMPLARSIGSFVGKRERNRTR